LPFIGNESGNCKALDVTGPNTIVKIKASFDDDELAVQYRKNPIVVDLSPEDPDQATVELNLAQVGDDNSVLMFEYGDLEDEEDAD